MSKPNNTSSSHNKKEPAKNVEERPNNTNESANQNADVQTTKKEIKESKEQLLLNEVAELKKQFEKSKSDYLYLLAEFDNYRRNAIKERSELLKQVCTGLIADLLGVIDNFERAIDVKLTPETFDSYRHGIEMTAIELKNVLKKYGITEIPAEGVAFDPSLHEALSAEETDKLPPGHITKVFKKPYKHHDKIIRTGQVVVAKEKS